MTPNRIASYYRQTEPDLTTRDLQWFNDVDEAYWSGFHDGRNYERSQWEGKALCALVAGAVSGCLVGLLVGAVIGGLV